MKPHKHAEVLRAIADGKEVEYLWGETAWFSKAAGVNPINYPHYEWRIKPEPKPDVVRYAIAKHDKLIACNQIWREHDNLLLTWDGETGKLKSAEVL